MIKLLSAASMLTLVLVLPRTDDSDAASLGGRVTDENQVAIADATVSASNVFSREVEVVRSDAAGLYRFTRMRQGRYSVFGRSEGHGCSWVFNVFLFRGQHTELDLTLPRSQKKVRSGDCTESREERK